MNSVDGLVSRSRSNGAARWTLGPAAGVASIAISTNGKIFAADRDAAPALMLDEVCADKPGSPGYKNVVGLVQAQEILSIVSFKASRHGLGSTPNAS